jgi:hypothetical protein
LLVLYDNTGRHYLDDYQMKAAMYGLECVTLAVPQDSRSKLSVVDRGFGERNNKTVAPEWNVELSAVGWLIENHDGLSFRCYHNKYAQCKLHPDWLRSERILHCRLQERQPQQFQEWEKF